MSSGVQRRVNGAVNGTGSLLNVLTVGFRPQKVRVLNIDGTTKLEWNNTMADDSGLKQVTAGTLSFITSNGVIPLGNGFSIGADSDVNVADELIHWEAEE